MSAVNFKRFNVPPVTKVVLLFNIALFFIVYYLKLLAKKQLLGANGDQGQPEGNEIIPQLNNNNLVVPLFELVPSQVIFHPWTLVVSSFVESSVTGLLITVLNTLVSIRYFEKVWGSKEIAKFLIVLSSITNLLTAVIVIMITAIASTSKANLEALQGSFGGSFSLIVGFIVAFKQIVPEHNLIFFRGTFHLRVKHVPFISVILLLLASLARKSYYPVLNSVISFVVAWVYLRFYQSMILEPLIPLTSSSTESTENNNNSANNDNDSQPFGVTRVKGDASDTFAFAYFFPDIIHPIVSPIFDIIYNALAAVGLVTKFNEEDVVQSNERAVRRSAARGARAAAGAGGSSNIAERRRQVALKVLEERIGTA